MIKSTLFVRVVSQDKDRGYMLLVGYEPKLVQSNCMQYTTLQGITRANLNAAIERISNNFNAAEIKDVTDAGLKKRLAKMFGEAPESKEVEAE